ncbi:hypothetical protein SASPL_115967 [Salvia splendens]|uniref:Morc S5 domain-containing protein n=1 Tax=Salvia splendens TaxID=180675 RepID=A0A8X8Y3H1_SALSN|nr:hypothetical protein SASPL_115967 [Salvia splendens]
MKQEAICLSDSSDYSSGADEFRQRRMEAVLPPGFLEPIRPLGFTSSRRFDGMVKQENVSNSKEVVAIAAAPITTVAPITAVAPVASCRQFWKAGDYEGCGNGANLYDEEMDHVRVHPKFLHSNATSHKWALGAFAELLDNALDESCNGATYCDINIAENMKDMTKMVVVQDNGGGMTPNKMRQCMSLGYSAKTKISGTIGQYGNGFKTSTMRLGADVIVFSRCQGKYGESSTQTIGLLSYSFLRGTGKEDIVVPMIDYEKKGEVWSQYVKSSPDCWDRNLETIIEWSPYQSEGNLLQQFDFLSEQGTRIVIYNLWDDDLGSRELDFDTDPHDIQLRGDERNEKKIKMADTYSSSSHFLTYRHSLRSYASILYRRLPPGFHMILRGKEVDHHDIISDLMLTESHVYKPAPRPDMPASRDPNMSATVTLGFVKDAHHHIDIQGFNVYHKNRLIKPFWRVWNAAGSDGRGVIAHDKQGFERTVALSRLENRLVHFQKTFWSTKCQLIGYAPRRSSKKSVSPDKTGSSEAEPSSAKRASNGDGEMQPNQKRAREDGPSVNGVSDRKAQCGSSTTTAAATTTTTTTTIPRQQPQSTQHDVKIKPIPRVQSCSLSSSGDEAAFSTSSNMVFGLKQENQGLRESLDIMVQELQNEREKCKSLQNELQNTKRMIATMDQEQEMLVTTFADERSRREEEEENLRSRLKDASDTIQSLLNKVKKLEEGRC